MDELTPVLQRFSLEVVEASRLVSRDVIAFCMNAVIQPLLSRLEAFDGRLKCYAPLPTETNFEALKVSAGNEFELLVVLEHLAAIKTFNDLAETSPSLACYGQVLVHECSGLGLDDLCTVNTASQHRALSATKVREYFARTVAKAATITAFQDATVQVRYKDPHTQVKISRHHDSYYFQLVPAIYFHMWPPCADLWGQQDRLTSWLTPEVTSHCRQLGFLAVPLRCPYSEEESLWRISFQRAEKYLLSYTYLDSPQGVVKQVERILRMLRTSDTDAFRPLSSYHLKTAVLHACLEWTDAGSWTPGRLGERLLDVLCRLVLALEKRELLHFFVPACNLLGHFTPQQCFEAAARLREIHKEFCLAPAHSIRLQC